jgi:hypothetical protein
MLGLNLKGFMTTVASIFQFVRAVTPRERSQSLYLGPIIFRLIVEVEDMRFFTVEDLITRRCEEGIWSFRMALMMVKQIHVLLFRAVL